MADLTTFPFSRNWWEALKAMDEDVRCELLAAIPAFVFDGIDPELSKAAAAAWYLIRIDLEQARQAYETKCAKNRANIQKRYERIRTYTNVENNLPQPTNVYERSLEKERKDKERKQEKEIPPKPPLIEKEINKEKERKERGGDAYARETPTTDNRQRLSEWVQSSDLAEWIQRKLHEQGLDHLTTDELLDAFHDNDFSVRERVAQLQRLDVLKHFQSWLPKYLTKQKEQNNGHTNNSAANILRDIQLGEALARGGKRAQ